MPEIIVICTANICRSPVVEALLRQRLQQGQQGQQDDWIVSSAGTLAWPGYGAAALSSELMAEQGIDISTHRSQRVEGPHLARASLALCMELGHKEALQIEFPPFRDKIFLLTEMIGDHREVPDPIGGPREAYEVMVADVTDLLDRGLPRIVELAQRPAHQTRGSRS